MPAPQRHHRRPARAADTVGPPPVSRALLRVFARYTRWYLGRHFHGVRLDLQGWRPPQPGPPLPTVFYLNHAAWWDPLICLHLRHHLMPHVDAFAPIDAVALEKYGFFRRLGFFGVEPGTARGAARFLRLAESVLHRPGATLWITPQGRFADVRERPVTLRSGLGHLAARLARAGQRVAFVPLAIEYPFWEERLPEVLVRLGPPLVLEGQPTDRRDPAEWSQAFERNLESTLDALAAGSRQRDAQRFTNLLQGRSGVGVVYDLWRRGLAALRGQPFNPRHSNL